MLQDLASSAPELAVRLELVEARDTIRKLKADYMQGLDDRLRGEVAGLFWPDAIWESLPDRAPEGIAATPVGAQIVGADAIAESFVAAARAMSFTAHFLTNEAIDVDLGADTATGRWKLLQACTATDGTAFWQAGVYTDTFTRRDGVWKFAHLRLALDFRTPFTEGWSVTRMWPLHL